MTIERNLQWCRDRVSRLVNFNLAQSNQSFTGPVSGSDDNIVLDDAINDAYQEEINYLQIEVGLQAFLARHTFSWPASQITYGLPQELIDKQIYDLRDETD